MRFFGAAGAIGLFLAVAFGAFAAHGLRSQLTPEMFGVLQTGVRYQFYHSLALLVVALLANKNRLFKFAGAFYIAGIIVFCSSLYVLSITGLRWIAFVTPLGGLSFLAGHVLLFLGFLKT